MFRGRASPKNDHAALGPNNGSPPQENRLRCRDDSGAWLGQLARAILGWAP